MAVTAGMVKELREKTGAGMMDWHALSETGGDLEKAIDYLRQKGLSDAAKRTRPPRGLSDHISIPVGRSACWWKSIESDFVARTKSFRRW